MNCTTKSPILVYFILLGSVSLTTPCTTTTSPPPPQAAQTTTPTTTTTPTKPPTTTHNATTMRSPRHCTEDKTYGGVTVDCHGQGLVAVPPSDWLPPETTSLLLQSNSISRLGKDAFLKVADLRYLTVAANNLHSIDPGAFRLNTKLKVLDFEYNSIRLNNHIMPAAVAGPWFKELHDLVELRLGFNRNDDVYDFAYPPDLLQGLTNLQNLSIDTGFGDLEFNGIFLQTPNLVSLKITGGLMTIRNESFRDFDTLKLSQLYLADVNYLKHTELGAFRYLTRLESFSIQGSVQGMTETLGSLQPFVGRNFTSLKFYSINADQTNLLAFERDSVLSRHAARFLSKICVKHFAFVDNNLFLIESRALVSRQWIRCLESLDLSSNPLSGEGIAMVELKKLNVLKFLRIANRKYSLLNTDPPIASSRYNPTSLLLVHRPNKTILINSQTALWNNYQSVSRNLTVSSLRHQEMKERVSISAHIHLDDERAHFHNGVRQTVYFPKEVVYFNLNSCGSHTMRLDADIHIVGGTNLREFHLSDCGIYHMKGRLHGIPNLQILDISKNDGSELTSYFMGSFPNVTRLSMSTMELHFIFASPDRHDLFHALSVLEHLDLSDNGIHTLPSNMFSRNEKLKYLSLAGNRLKILPSHGQLVPEFLQTLDIRGNSFLQFSEDTLSEFERHAQEHPSFSLKLEGNVFACGCTSMTFLHWLQSTVVSLDNDRNYSCILASGQIARTSDLKDVSILWRQCNGEIAFVASLFSFFFLTVVLFPAAKIYLKNKTRITAAIFQFVNNTFAPKVPTDYPTGVYVGYADQDADFACLRLRRFIEDQLHLSTYVRHRDLAVGSDMASSLVTAVNSSWRIALVLSPGYLGDEWTHLTMKTAVYSVTNANPGRLVLVLLSEDIGHRVPDDVLTAVREDNIIRVLSGANDVIDFTDEERDDLAKALMG